MSWKERSGRRSRSYKLARSRITRIIEQGVSRIREHRLKDCERKEFGFLVKLEFILIAGSDPGNFLAGVNGFERVFVMSFVEWQRFTYVAKSLSLRDGIHYPPTRASCV